MTEDQVNEILHRIDRMEFLGAIAVIAICATLFIVGFMARFRK